jgi:uncharacterized protein
VAEQELSQGFPAPPPPGLAEGSGGAAPRWGLLDALVTWLAGMAGGFITVTLVLLATGAETMEEVSLGAFALAQSGLWAGLLVMVVLISHLKGMGPVRDYGLQIRLRDVPVGVVCGFGGQMLINLLYLPVVEWTDITSEDISEVAESLTDRADGIGSILLLTLIVGIMAPIVEEIFYRGMVQRAMERRWGPTPGLLAASLIFGLVHFQPLLLPGLAVAGLIFGLLAQRARRLGPAIVAHMAFNMTTVVALVGEA